MLREQGKLEFVRFVGILPVEKDGEYDRSYRFKDKISLVTVWDQGHILPDVFDPIRDGGVTRGLRRSENLVVDTVRTLGNQQLPDDKKQLSVAGGVVFLNERERQNIKGVWQLARDEILRDMRGETIPLAQIIVNVARSNR